MAVFSAKIKGILGIFIVCFLYLIAGKIALAETETENFDSYATGNINVNTLWASSTAGELVSNTQYLSSPNSLKSSTGGNPAVYFNSENQFLNNYQVKFSFRTPATVGGSTSYQVECKNKSSGHEIWQIRTSVSNPQLVLRASSTNYTIANTINTNTWYTITVNYNNYTSYVSAGNGTATTSSVLIGENSRGETCEVLYFFGLSTAGNDFYTDNLIIDNQNISITGTEDYDYINLNQPQWLEQFNSNNLLTSVKPLSEFIWDYAFHISSTTKALYSTYDIYVLLNKVDPDTHVMSATTSQYLRANVSMSEIDSNETYIIRVADPNIVPDEIGGWIGTISLIADGTHLLAYDDVGFVVGSSEIGGDHYWCENACLNVASSSDGFMGGFELGFKCGGLKLLCYAFYPPPSVLTQLFDAWAIATSSFPMSVGYDLVNPIVEAGDLDASTSTVYNLAPLRWSGNLIASTSLLTNKTLENGMGAYLYGIYWTWSGYLIWTLFFIYLLARFISMTGGFHANWSVSKEEGEEHLTRLPNGAFKVVKSPDKRRWWRSGWFNKRS